MNSPLFSNAREHNARLPITTRRRFICEFYSETGSFHLFALFVTLPRAIRARSLQIRIMYSNLHSLYNKEIYEL